MPVTMTGEPFCSLIWPAATTRSPGLSPSRIATLSPQRVPVLTGVRIALRIGLPLGVLAVLADHIDAVAVERVVDRGLRQHHLSGSRRQHHLGVDEHAGQQRFVGVRHRRLNIMVRVSALICGSIVVISAVKVRPGKASAVTSTVCPTMISGRIVAPAA